MQATGNDLPALFDSAPVILRYRAQAVLVYLRAAFEFPIIFFRVTLTECWPGSAAPWYRGTAAPTAVDA